MPVWNENNVSICLNKRLKLMIRHDNLVLFMCYVVREIYSLPSETIYDV